MLVSAVELLCQTQNDFKWNGIFIVGRSPYHHKHFVFEMYFIQWRITNPHNAIVDCRIFFDCCGYPYIMTSTYLMCPMSASLLVVPKITEIILFDQSSERKYMRQLLQMRKIMSNNYNYYLQRVALPHDISRVLAFNFCIAFWQWRAPHFSLVNRSKLWF